MLEYAPSKWMAASNEFWEHGHRLFASLVGLVTSILLVTTYIKTPKLQRPHFAYIAPLGVVFVLIASTIVLARDQPSYMEMLMGALAVMLIIYLVRSFAALQDSRLVWLSMTAFVAVCLQGLFGGFAVLYGDPIFTLSWAATVHGVLAEIFFLVVVAIALYSSKGWNQQTVVPTYDGSVRLTVMLTWILTFVQFILGAITRHLEAWLHSSHFPQWSPAGFFPSQEALGETGILVHVVHRTAAYLVAGMVIVQMVVLYKRNIKGVVMASATANALLVVAQIFLGAGIVWFQRDETITTLHVMVGVMLMLFNNIVMLSVQPLRVPSIALQPADGIHPLHAGGQS